MVKVAVILSGCGHLDGAEISESVLSLLYLDEAGAEVEIFASDKQQHHVVNHLSGDEVKEYRNILVESARIARGDIKPLSQLDSKKFDALILPGGFGVAKNYSNLAFEGPTAVVQEDYRKAIWGFHSAGKPIGAICISPAVVAIALKEEAPITVTLGDKENAKMITGCGSKHEHKETTEICIDDKNNIISTSAYMRNDKISRVGGGIKKLVDEVINRT